MRRENRNWMIWRGRNLHHFLRVGLRNPPPLGIEPDAAQQITGSLWPDVARRASRRGIVQRVAMQANAHRRGAGGFRHRFHLGHLAVAGFAFHAGVQVFAVRPRHAGEDLINANPWHGLA